MGDELGELSTGPAMADESKLVSIGVPVFNGERYIARAIQSLQAQDYPELEIIISDNASTDATPAICAAMAEGDPRIRFYRNQENIGAVPNFALLPAYARGSFFMWAAYDDTWSPSCVRLLVETLEAHPLAGLAFSGVVLMDEEGQSLATQIFPPEDDPTDWSQLQTTLRTLQPARGRPKLNYAMYGLYRSVHLRRAISSVRDVPLWDRLFVALNAMMFPFAYCPEPVYFRTIQRLGADQRYPDDQYSRQIKTSQSWRLQSVLNLAVMLLGSRWIPWTSKFQIPYVVFVFANEQRLKLSKRALNARSGKIKTERGGKVKRKKVGKIRPVIK